MKKSKRPRMTSWGPLIMSNFDRFVGIDISKNRLDIYCHPCLPTAHYGSNYRRALKRAGGVVPKFGEATAFLEAH
jgi:hypothetical protein